MYSIQALKNLIFIGLLSVFLLSCKAIKNLPGGDARKYSYDEKERIKKNLEEGRGFRLNKATLSGITGGGTFDFVSSNELWKASLDVIDFMPLSSVNYSGGIIITDWYSENQNPNESIKITIRFLTNEVRSDALDIKVFNRKCLVNLLNCKFTQTDGVLVTELKKEILKKAALYKENKKNNN
tara:strand:+ start:26 stop:571 length:546 start_codon:yes stop_codon:yes gene_type:complete